MCVCVWACRDSDVAARLHEWSITCANVIVQLKSDSGVTHQPTAMRSVLRQLTSLSTASHVPVCLKGWQWSHDLAQAVLAALPALTHLKLTTDITTCTVLTDALLGVALQLAPHMPSLTVRNLDLQTSQHASTPWPWEELTIDTLDIAELCKLPMPGLVNGKMPKVCYTKLAIAKGLAQSEVSLWPPIS